MIIYTTIEQELQLDKRYYEKIELKKKKIAQREKETGKIEKYTAYAYVKRKPRIFIFDSNQLGLLIDDKIMPVYYYKLDSVPESNLSNDIIGCIYKTDSDFNSQVANFISTHNKWKISFYLDKIQGGLAYVSSDLSDVPAKLSGLTENLTEIENDFLILEDEDKYDIVCG